MARLHDQVLNCSFYLYKSKADAQMGTNEGGSAFNVCVEVEGRENVLLVYVVTARHLVTQGYRTLRVNRSDGGVDVLEIPSHAWKWPADGGDIAVTPIKAQWDEIDIMLLPAGLGLTRDRCKQDNIGIGDPVYMVGRLLHHEGRMMNTPAVRFGNISMMPLEPVLNEHTGLEQESFLVEMRSISGYSGSPVFVYKDEPFGPSTRILGVDWGHLPGRNGMPNAGIACVVPSWTLLKLLYEDDIVRDQRRRVAERLPEAGSQGATPDSATDDDEGISREEVLGALEKATEPEEPSDGERE